MVRHCAYCLKKLETVKLCGRCHRRAYCSPECQKIDWIPGGMGQGHKNWCGEVSGEEDIDWKVDLISEEKGLGLVALVDIPAGYRILVDRAYTRPDHHPAIGDLEPKHGTKREKFELNMLGCAESDNQGSVVCLRLSRINHSCDNNAQHYYCKDMTVNVVFAERDIKSGEEICIGYVDWWRHLDNMAFGRQLLAKKWGINCPPDCTCSRPEFFEELKVSHKMDRAIENYGSVGKINLAVSSAEQLLSYYDSHPRLGLLRRIRTLYDAFQVAITQKSTLAKGLSYITLAADLEEKISSKKCAKVVQWRKWSKSAGSHRNYLILG
ncbi:hypothetical protein HDU76_001381 [Blyttiomyces sp. JEL0837]|nr:hypothetical protein HDU76_001381 [Blyttiomyces sp. JEL0837]